MQKKAYHTLILPDGSIRRLVVVEFSEQGEVLGYHSLMNEEPFVEWVGGCLDLAEGKPYLKTK